MRPTSPVNNPVNKANNFCLHSVSRRNKTTPVRGIGRRCEKRLKVSGLHSNFDSDRPVLSQERFPPSGFLTRAVPFLQRRQQSFFEAFGRRLFLAIFRPAGKSGETPDARRQWNLQTMDPKGRPRSPLEMQGKSTRILRLSIRTMLQRLLQTSRRDSRRKVAVAPATHSNVCVRRKYSSTGL